MSLRERSQQFQKYDARQKIIREIIFKIVSRSLTLMFLNDDENVLTVVLAHYVTV
ncbi:hypothetical protein X777_10355 [Ooceraea biroi]|uniref:Uncharacterized protein n=1 Tax=Ooceraea biroi TaxID=2015173 RepID=A0A026W4T4_OOCBI|nr:hypothetical protein X777_10355 [Ooceraea biroi]